jgi:pimeloyl-ACP methyl ester carboxylesterase
LILVDLLVDLLACNGVCRYAPAMAQAHVNGITLEYEVHGSGEPLLLIMGLGGQMVSWPSGFITGLSDRGFQVIVFDNRDIGLSSKMVSPPMTNRQMMAAILAPSRVSTEYYLSDMAHDSVGLLDHLGFDSAHIVGISMGGMIAQTIAMEHPLRARSLCSIMSTTGSRRVGRMDPRLLTKLPKLTSGSKETYVAREIEVFRLISGSTFDESETRATATACVERSYCPDGVRRQAAAIFGSPDRTEKLGMLSVPTLVVHGLEDTLVQPSGGIATARAIPGSRLLMFPDMGHNLPKHRWSELFDALQTNCRRASGATGANHRSDLPAVV